MRCRRPLMRRARRRPRPLAAAIARLGGRRRRGASLGAGAAASDPVADVGASTRDAHEQRPSSAAAPMPTTRNAVRGELSVTSAPPSARPIAGHSAPSDSTAPITRPCRAVRREPLHGADQRTPTGCRCRRRRRARDAGKRERGREREAEVGEPDASVPALSIARSGRRRSARTRCCRARADAPRGQRAAPKPRSPACRRDLGVGDLDRRGGLEEHERDRLRRAAARAARAPALMCPQAARSRARTDSPAASSTWGCRSSSSAPQIRNEAASMNSAVGAPGPPRSRPPSAGPDHEGRRERDVQRRVGLLLGRLASSARVAASRRPSVLGAPAASRAARAISARSSALAASAAVPSSATSTQHRRQPEVPQQDRQRGGRRRASKRYRRAQLAPRRRCLHARDQRGHERTPAAPVRRRAARPPRARCACGRTPPPTARQAEPRAQPVDRVRGEDPAQPRRRRALIASDKLTARCDAA